jgi:GH24 family phage-related lysozyme (muramidase)
VAVALGIGGAVVSAAAARQSPPARADYTVTPDLVMVIKYYEGIPTTPTVKGDQPPDTDQSPSLRADRANKYDDSGGDCTIGWGHLFYPPHPCSKEPSFPKGVTLPTANYQLRGDLNAKVNLIDTCLGGVTLSPGQFRSLVSLVFQHGSSLIGTDCKGPVTKALKAPKSNTMKVLVEEIRAYHSGNRAAWEIWDATNGKEGSPRPPAWTVATEIEQQGTDGKITAGGDGEIKIAPAGEDDALAGVKPTESFDCATTAEPQKKCGPFYIDEQVKITAKPAKNWKFAGWEAPKDGTGDTRDLCAKPKQQGATCTVAIQDQLVRAIAVFKPSCQEPGAAGDARAAGGPAGSDGHAVSSEEECPIAVSSSGTFSGTRASASTGFVYETLKFKWTSTSTFGGPLGQTVEGQPQLSIIDGTVSEPAYGQSPACTASVSAQPYSYYEDDYAAANMSFNTGVVLTPPYSGPTYYAVSPYFGDGDAFLLKSSCPLGQLISPTLDDSAEWRDSGGQGVGFPLPVAPGTGQPIPPEMPDTKDFGIDNSVTTFQAYTYTVNLHGTATVAAACGCAATAAISK